MTRALLVLLLASGCGLTTVSREYLAERDLEFCLERYCHGYGGDDQPPYEECAYRFDAVPICQEDEERKRRENQGWFAQFLLAIAEAFP